MFVLAALSTASAQSLHNKWYKVLVKADTSRLNTDTGFFSSYKFQFYVYVHLEYVGPGDEPYGAVYNWEIWTKNEFGQWSVGMRDTIESDRYCENFLIDCWMCLSTEKDDWISSYVTPRIVATPLGNAFIAGGEIYAGHDREWRRLFGWLTMTGQMVPRPKWAVG